MDLSHRSLDSLAGSGAISSHTTHAPQARPGSRCRRVARRLALLAAAAIATGCAVAGPAAEPASASHVHGGGPGDRLPSSSPLVNKVRVATRRYLDINVALGEGWVPATPCVSGPNEGAMGVHFLKPDRLHDGALKADEPELLIYEPQRGGGYRLVGVEYLVLASEWASRNPAGTAPSVDGHLANFVGEPNRYALPSFYELHVWAWEDNPSGSFSDWNPRVSCDRQAAN
ncbi:hypothetical protein [Pelomonas cellulosilytica]|uniref:Uncharacterized protein n=1 Tax=Pelomonas cellulosilytica TaxID=2906762 RepID=A0ABS8XUS4_9BURK|nr:hypothetical protein [Pelomonas sp. P8]MCE4555425.1 hypothetical protein [Pelomonas sp. P8]